MNRYPSPDWEILGDKGVAQSAGVSQRYLGLHGIIKDVFLLAECDLVICTFSSQVSFWISDAKQTKWNEVLSIKVNQCLPRSLF